MSISELQEQLERKQELIDTLKELICQQRECVTVKAKEFGEKQETTKETIDRLRKELEEEKEIRRLEAESFEIQLRDVDFLFEHLEKVEGSTEAISKRRIECGWTEDGRFCSTPATHALCRPKICVCTKHQERWREEVELVEEEARQGAKRMRNF